MAVLSLYILYGVSPNDLSFKIISIVHFHTTKSHILINEITYHSCQAIETFISLATDLYFLFFFQKETQQRLIYSGKLLADEMTLKEIIIQVRKCCLLSLTINNLLLMCFYLYLYIYFFFLY